MSTPAYTKAGVKATTPAKLPKEVFGVEVKSHGLLKQAYTAYLANGRTNNARTLKRGEVRGGGKKPWKQKGTGRARFGSSRVPIWRGGGITFGPTGDENYSHKLPLSTKRKALCQALSLASTTGKISVIESFDIKDGKTAATAKLMDKIGAKGNVLLVVGNKDENVVRSTRNVAKLIVVQAKYLNVFDILNADCIVLDEASVVMINEWLGSKSAPKVTEAAK